LEYYKVTSVRYKHELENIINSREKVRRALVSQRLRAYAMEVVFALRNVRYSFAGNQGLSCKVFLVLILVFANWDNKNRLLALNIDWMWLRRAHISAILSSGRFLHSHFHV